MSDSECSRCKGRVPTIDNVLWTTFWGGFRKDITTHTTRSIHISSLYTREDPDYGSRVLNSSSDMPLCSDCWGLLVGNFLQGRTILSLEEQRAKQNRRDFGG